MKCVQYKDLGLIDYKQAWDYQEKLLANIIEKKLQPHANVVDDNFLLFCEHPHVYTLGKSGEANNLLINDEFLNRIQATYYKINRGGDITYHGPGQLVGYPIFDLEKFHLHVKEYVHHVEEAIIRMLNEYGIFSTRLEGATGVWLDTDNPQRCRKICAIGVRVSRWVTMHGFALNANTDLNYFNHINPCGFTDKGVTSMQKELGYEIDIHELKTKLRNQFEEIFGFQSRL